MASSRQRETELRLSIARDKNGKLLANHERLRGNADYRTDFSATADQSKEAIAAAEEFVKEAERVLEKIRTQGESNVH